MIEKDLIVVLALPRRPLIYRVGIFQKQLLNLKTI